MGSFYQTEVMEKFIAEEKESEDLGGDLDGVIIWGHKPMLFLHRLSLNTPPLPPTNLRRGRGFRFARLVIDAQWRLGEGARARERETEGGRRRI